MTLCLVPRCAASWRWCAASRTRLSFTGSFSLTPAVPIRKKRFTTKYKLCHCIDLPSIKHIYFLHVVPAVAFTFVSIWEPEEERCGLRAQRITGTAPSERCGCLGAIGGLSAPGAVAGRGGQRGSPRGHLAGWQQGGGRGVLRPRVPTPGKGATRVPRRWLESLVRPRAGRAGCARGVGSRQPLGRDAGGPGESRRPQSRVRGAGPTSQSQARGPPCILPKRWALKRAPRGAPGAAHPQRINPNAQRRPYARCTQHPKGNPQSPRRPQSRSQANSRPPASGRRRRSKSARRAGPRSHPGSGTASSVFSSHPPER